MEKIEQYDKKIDKYKVTSIILGIALVGLILTKFFTTNEKTATPQIEPVSHIEESTSTSEALHTEEEEEVIELEERVFSKKDLEKEKGTITSKKNEAIVVPKKISIPSSKVQTGNSDTVELASLADNQTTRLLKELEGIQNKMLTEDYPALLEIDNSNLFSVDSYYAPDLPAKLTMLNSGIAEIENSEAIAQELYTKIKTHIESSANLSSSQQKDLLSKLDEAIEKRPHVETRKLAKSKMEGFYKALKEHFEFLTKHAYKYRVTSSIETGWVEIKMDNNSLQSQQDALLEKTLETLDNYSLAAKDYIDYFRLIPPKFTAHLISQASQADFDYLIQEEISYMIDSQGGLPYYEENWIAVIRYEYVDNVIILEYVVDLDQKPEDKDDESYVDEACDNPSAKAILDRADMRLIFNIWANKARQETVEEFVLKGERCSALF